MSEILAPAGSPEMLCAAVRAGADAVYFGLDGFNARRNAENFTCENISRYTAYCRRRDVRTYLTLNTLVADDELSGAVRLIRAACDSGVDAVLVQDMGLVDVIKSCAPGLALHASTQMAVHNTEGVEFLHRLGFSRVVLARENSKTEIKNICARARELGMEIEVFVQGALCMCVSGQCLMSAVLGGRSGNRGLCAGTCRLPFSVEGSADEYALSLKDLSLLSDLSELTEMGVCSFKIEGRMKRPEYAAAAVSAVIAARDNSADFRERFQLLQSVFSRSGFTDGYYAGRLNGDMFGVRSEQDITKSRRVMSSIHGLYRTEYPRVPLKMEFTAKTDEKTSLFVTDGEHAVCVFGGFAETAVHTPTDPQFVIKKLMKLGGTGYYAQSVNAAIDDGLKISAGELSELRGSALDVINKQREKLVPTEFTAIDIPEPQKRRPRQPKFLLSLHDISQLPDDLSILNGLILPLSVSDEAATELSSLGLELWAKTPPVIFGDGSQVVNRLKRLKSIGIKTAVAENIGTLEMISRAGLSAIGGASLNCYNSLAAKSYGLSGFIASREMSQRQFERLDTAWRVGLEIYGRTPMMTVRNCPIRARVGCRNCTGYIIDRKKASLPVFCEDSVTRIYNDRPTYLADLPELLKSADFCVISLTTENRKRAAEILKMIENGEKFDSEFTRGMTLKGVL